MGITRGLLLLPAGLAYFPAELEKDSEIHLGHKYTGNIEELRTQEAVTHIAVQRINSIRSLE